MAGNAEDEANAPPAPKLRLGRLALYRSGDVEAIATRLADAQIRNRVTEEALEAAATLLRNVQEEHASEASAAEEHVANLQQSLEHEQSLRNATEARLNSLTESIRVLSEAQNNLTSEISGLNATAAQGQEEISRLEKLYRDAVAEHERAATDSAARQHDEVAWLKQQYRQDIAEQEAKVVDMAARHRDHTAKLERQYHEVATERDIRAAEAAAMREAGEELRLNLQRLNQEREFFSQEINRLRQQEIELTATRAALTEKFEAVRGQLQQLLNEKAAVEEVAQRAAERSEGLLEKAAQADAMQKQLTQLQAERKHLQEILTAELAKNLSLCNQLETAQVEAKKREEALNYFKTAADKSIGNNTILQNDVAELKAKIQEIEADRLKLVDNLGYERSARDRLNGQVQELAAAGQKLEQFRHASNGVVEIKLRFTEYLDYLSRWEPEIRFLPHLTNSNRTSVDIGANIGCYSSLLAPLSKLVLAVEPNAMIVPHMAMNLQRWENCRILCAAIGNRNGFATLVMPRVGNNDVIHSSYGSLVHDFSNEYPAHQIGRQSVLVFQLDQLQLPEVSFIKIDVEGAELAVLEGAGKTLKRERPNLIMELEKRHNAEAEHALRFLKRADYAGYFFDRQAMKVMPLAEFSFEKHQAAILEGGSEERMEHEYIFNFIFTPSERDVMAQFLRA